MESTTEQSVYVGTLQYLNRVRRPVSPHELAFNLRVSRVSIHNALKRLLASGWIMKEGKSPKAVYRAIDPFAKQKPLSIEQISVSPHTIEAFIVWCRSNKYHVPEIVLEYQHLLKVSQK